MSTLNILCVICSEFYASTDIVYSTGCGHLFHKSCLDRWLRTSRTCPECRQTYNHFRAHRVFLNFSEPTELDEENMDTNTYPEWRILTTSVVNGVLVHDPPFQPLESGVDLEGNKVYVARCPINEDIVPANYIPNKNVVHLPWNCAEHIMPLDEVEYLVDDGSYSWVSAAHGEIPQYSIVVGYATLHEGGTENLYTGRANYRGITYPGKIHPSHKVLYMPCEGKEMNIGEYEVLVRLPQESKENETVVNEEEQLQA